MAYGFDTVQDKRRQAWKNFNEQREHFVRGAGRFSVSDTERKAVAGRAERLEDEDRLRQFEMDQLKQQGENALGVEKTKAEGMIGQGSKAAEFNADATKHAADKQAEAALKKAEVDAANGAAQWGKFDNAGNFTPGSEVKKAELTTQATFENARLEREARISAAEKMATGRTDVAKIKAASDLDVAKAKATTDQQKATDRVNQADQRAFDQWLANLNDLNKSAGMSQEELQKIKGMTPEEQRAYWLKMTGRSN